MIFWIILILLAGSVFCLTWSEDYEGLFVLGVLFCTVFGVVAGVMTGIVCSTNIRADAIYQSELKRYESLTYQLKTGMYDNDNEYGKKELYDQIEEWNCSLAEHKELQRNFWSGIFYPNIYDDLKFIEYPIKD